ncbi:reverse transcriptase domain-containing protein, partial [Tanacetum coccineum]
MKKIKKSHAEDDFTSFDDLADEIVYEILSKFSDLKTLCICELVCKRFYRTVLQVEAISFTSVTPPLHPLDTELYVSITATLLRSFQSAMLSLKKFTRVKSICIQLSRPFDNPLLFKWKIKFRNQLGTLLVLSPNSVYHNQNLHVKEYSQEEEDMEMKNKIELEYKDDAVYNEAMKEILKMPMHEISKHSLSTISHLIAGLDKLKSLVNDTVFTRLGPRDRNVFTRLGERRRSVHSQLGPDIAPRHRHASTRRSASLSSKRQREIEKEWDAADCASRRPPARTEELYLSKNDHDQGGHWKRDPEDHLKIFQEATKIERWAMTTWCHMFNSTLIGSARVWFNKLPPESIDNYEMLRKVFLWNYSQQKKYIKDPVEIHHIKQREGESTEAFMERIKAESMHVSGAPECMRISGFMH